MNVANEIAAGEALIATLPHVLTSHLVGSAMYAPDPKDVDFAVLVDMSNTACVHNYFTEALELLGFELCTDGNYPEGDDGWFAARCGNLNLMVMRDAERFEKYLAAMEVCKYLRLTERSDRIAVCKIVRDGYTADMIPSELF